MHFKYLNVGHFTMPWTCENMLALLTIPVLSPQDLCIFGNPEYLHINFNTALTPWVASNLLISVKG